MRGLEQALDLAWSQSVFRFQRDPLAAREIWRGYHAADLKYQIVAPLHRFSGVGQRDTVPASPVYIHVASIISTTPGRLDSMDRRGGLSYRVGFGKIYGSRNASERWMPSPQYLLSLPERVFRSMSALSAGLLRELSEVVLPRAVRRTRLYTELVENTLRFLIENVGQVEGTYPPQGKLADNFAMRRFAGNGIELVGLLTFSASPVWVLAALADLSGAGRQLIREIAQSLKDEGLLARGRRIRDHRSVVGRAGRRRGPPRHIPPTRRRWT